MGEELIRKYLSEEDSYNFKQWAWGKDFENLTTIEICYRWNENHYKDAFRISPNDAIENTIYIMMLWWVTKVKK